MTQSTAEKVREMCRDKINELRGHRDVTPAPVFEALSAALFELARLDLSALSDEREAVCQDGMCLIAEARGEQCRCTGRCAYREEA